MPLLSSDCFLVASSLDDLARWAVVDDEGAFLGLSAMIGERRFYIPLVEAPEGAVSKAWTGEPPAGTGSPMRPPVEVSGDF